LSFGENIGEKMDRLIKFYKKMFLIRKVEDAIIEHYYDDEMKTPMHMSRGSEAIAVGVCSALGDRGQYFSTYRSHAPYFASGGDLNKFFLEMYGKKEGRYAGKAGSMHIASPETGHISSSAIVASNIPVAIGAAWANKMQDNGKIVAVFFGDGAMDEGNFWESINMASLWSLPIIFVCEDNRVAVHTLSKNRQGYREIIPIIEEFEIATSYSLGIDVEDVYGDVKNAVRCVDNFKEPAFMQFEYYRYLEHVGTNSDINEEYRKKDTWEPTDDNDPVLDLRKKLIHVDVDVEGIEMEIAEDVYTALEIAKDGEFSDSKETYKDVFYG
jgi:TPP-dependent pyruvate/acetoin dehydrogenase alpha subunit